MEPGTHHRRRDCRLCGSEALEPVISLTPTPPANQFVPATALGRPQPCFPLDVHLCTDCGHVQLVDVVDPALLFEDYVYVSGTSPVFIEHFRRSAASLVARFDLGDGDLALDIGSNDGVLLRAIADLGPRILGIDPARDIAREANQAGIPTVAEFFTADLAGRLAAEHGRARLVTANNVFAHSDDLRGVTEGVRTLLAPDGAFVFEVSYLADVYEQGLFDTIYHEHLAYHSLKPLMGFFERAAMEVFDAERIPTHGGSIRVYVQHAGGPHRATPNVDAVLAAENELGLDRIETFLDWGRRIDAQGRRLKEQLETLRAGARRIAGFGAPAKATTLMYHFGIDRQTIEYIVDDSPLKQGLYSPGLHVPVVAADEIAVRRPDCLLILAWNFAEPIMAKHRDFLAGGGSFLVPLPEVRLISGPDSRS